MLASYALIIAGAVCVLVATLVGGFGAGWTFLPPLPVLPGRAVVDLVGEPLLRRQPARRRRLLRLLPRRARADDEHATAASTRTLGWQFLRGREQEAPPPQAIAATVVAIDGLLSMAAGIAIVARAARPHLRPRRRHRRAGRQEPRLLLRPLDREPDHLPRRRRRLRAHAALRRPPVRDDQGVRRRLGRLARLHRDRLLAPPLHGLRPAASGRRSISEVASYGGADPGRGDHDLLDDDARLGLRATAGRSPRPCSTSASPAGRSAAPAR